MTTTDHCLNDDPRHTGQDAAYYFIVDRPQPLADLLNPEAEAYLLGKGALVVPDLLSGGGGLLASYLEWVQDLNMFFWSPEEVRERFETRVARVVDAVCRRAERGGLDLRMGALALALERLDEATRLRGVYP